MTKLTEDYYNTIAFELSNDDDFYYNGSLLVDIDSDQKTFIDQDVENIIGYSNLGNSVLECGCGGGYFFKRLIKKLPDIEYQGIDLSSGQIEHAKKVNPDHADRFQVASWDDLPFEDESFDSILFLETMGYAENPDKMISECYRVLKPGGTVFNKHPGCSYMSFKRDPFVEEMVNSLSFYKGSYDSQTGDIYVSTYAKAIGERIIAMEREYGYTEKSLGMFMSFPYIIDKFEKNNFLVPNGIVYPIFDSSFHLKILFREEVQDLFEFYKHDGHSSTLRYIDADPHKFWNSAFERLNDYNLQLKDILSPIGKKHPNLCNMCMQVFSDTNLKETKDKMSACMLFTAIKQ